MPDTLKWLGDGLKALVATPVSLFLAVCIVGLVILYAPPVPGLGLQTVRLKAGPWVGLVTLAAGVLFVVRSLAFIAYNGVKIGLAWLDSRAPKTNPSLILTTNPHIASATWGRSKQSDESVVTEIMLDFFAHNQSDQLIYIRSARLIWPRVPLRDTLPVHPIVSAPYDRRTFSPRHPILPGGDAEGRVVLTVRRSLGRQGKMLGAVIGLTDQTGHEYRLKAKLWPMPTQAPPAEARRCA
jgi:hypothetical protein